MGEGGFSERCRAADLRSEERNEGEPGGGGSKGGVELEDVSDGEGGGDVWGDCDGDCDGGEMDIFKRGEGGG